MIFTYLGPILTGIAAVIVAVGGYITIYGKNRDSAITSWEKLYNTQEKRITELENRIREGDIEYEKTLKERDENHKLAVKEALEKSTAIIKGLEKRIEDLEKELENTKLVTAKVDEAKTVLHETVDNSLNEIKNQ